MTSSLSIVVYGAGGGSVLTTFQKFEYILQFNWHIWIKCDKMYSNNEY